MEETVITAYGCDPDEAALFRKLASRYGMRPVITHAAVSEDTVELAVGSRCISVNHKSPLTPSILRALSKVGVEYISTRSAGYNHIDVDFAKSIGIAVGNVAYSPDSVADYTLMLMLMAVRNIKPLISRTDHHDFRLDGLRGKELRDMTVGIVGTGRIGGAVIKRLQGFGCRIVAYDHHSKIASAEYMSLEELLHQSDIVSLHAPLTDMTQHLLSRRRFEQMKHGAFVINTARGALIDTDALIAMLESGRVGGAILDVLEGEEGIFYIDHREKTIENKQLLRLQELPNAVVTPHAAYYTDHALHDMVENSIINCLKFKKEKVLWVS